MFSCFSWEKKGGKSGGKTKKLCDKKTNNKKDRPRFTGKKTRFGSHYTEVKCRTHPFSNVRNPASGPPFLFLVRIVLYCTSVCCLHQSMLQWLKRKQEYNLSLQAWRKKRRQVGSIFALKDVDRVVDAAPVLLFFSPFMFFLVLRRVW